MHLKLSSGNWRPFCLGLNVLNKVDKHDKGRIAGRLLLPVYPEHNGRWGSDVICVSRIMVTQGMFNPCLRINVDFALYFGPPGRYCRTRSTLAQVMACCLTAPSHYLNWTNVDLSSVRTHGIHLRALSLDNVKIPINKRDWKLQF